MLGSLDEEGHQKRGDGRNTMPPEITPVESDPKRGIEEHQPNHPRAGQPCSGVGKKLFQLFRHQRGKPIGRYPFLEKRNCSGLINAQPEPN